jgi:hypothetical protein
LESEPTTTGDEIAEFVFDTPPFGDVQLAS